MPSTILGALLLGMLQGLTEFLPVSSSGHLALAQIFIDVPGNDVFFDLMLHLGTLVPAIAFFWKDLRAMVVDVVAGDGPFWARPGVRMAALVLAATIPTAVIGLAFKDLFEAQFSSLVAIGWGFILSGLLMWGTGRLPEGPRGLFEVPVWMAVAIGVAQGISISPSISRSGATIAVALFLGLSRDVAVRLSFVMSIPAILGACLLQLDEVDLSAVDPAEVAAGTLASLLVGWASLALLVRLVQQGQLRWFAWYLWAIGGLSLVLALTRPSAG